MASRHQWDDFVLDLDAYRLERSGVPLALEPKAFNLLALMVQRPGHLFTKQEIFDALWTDTAVTDHALTRVVAQLRRVLGDEAREARYLETVPTRGYRWIRPVAPVKPLEPMEPVEPVAPRLSSITAALVLGLTALGFLGWAQRHAPAAAAEATSEPRHGVNWPVQFTTHGGLDFQPAMLQVSCSSPPQRGRVRSKGTSKGRARAGSSSVTHSEQPGSTFGDTEPGRYFDRD